MGIITDVHEHIACVNYESDSTDSNKKPIIEISELLKGKIREEILSESNIVLIMKGKFSISYEKHINETIKEGKMLLLPSNSKYIARAEEDASALIFRLRDKVDLCDRMGLEQLYNKYKTPDQNFNLLDIKEEVAYFMNGLKKCVSDGLKCRYYLEMKIKELFFLMRAYYTKEELARFFYPMLSNDMSFSEFVYNNYNKVKTVQDLAALSNYSHSGFIKRFKKSFGVPAYQWMKQQKASRILHEINCTDKTLKEICEDHDFSSLSQFNDFCKSNFGYPPSYIRKNRTF